ncbi:MAG: hypothetical protein MJ066_05145, partial [Clostridia bacterium]|nr:hypothetical protein [Clostridia bacterium]
MQKNKKKDKDKFVEELVSEVVSDFENRQLQRKKLERQWQLNMNFLNGNQYCFISRGDEILDENASYCWQGREVFNHIAPLMESRLARFHRISPVI